MKSIKPVILSLLLLVLSSVGAQAQNIIVQSFRMDETDLTPNTTGTIVFDQNGDKCALIKVETTQQGFMFDVGSLGVRKVEQKVGEIWVYVPEGVKRITISHQQLGMLRDYDLGQTLKRARTYIMKITTGEVQTIVKQARTSQYVVFQLTPPNAVVDLNGEMLATADGVATKYVPFGTYDYTVKAPDYLPEVGKVAVNDPKQKHVVNVKLRPNFSQVTITVDNQAEIWVNGQKRGNGSWTGTLGVGIYELEARLPNHRSTLRQQNIAVTDQPQTIRLDAPTPILGEANISSTPAMADVTIDGKPSGQTPLLVSDLLIGQHSVKISRKGYADYTGTLTVSEGQTADLAATLKKEEAPTPDVVSVVQTTSLPTKGLNIPVKELSIIHSTPINNSTPVVTGALPITVKDVTFQMIPVQGGTFTMGGTSEQGKDALDDEKPTHQVTLSSYYIGETEVTQALWQAVMGSNPSYFKGGNRPVECVSWDDCQTFIQKLNQLTGRNFRLPTEAEWEYAARGGQKSRGYKYSGGNRIDAVAVYEKNSYKKGSSSPEYGTHDVKTKQANELGLYDMSGNVWEWCQDWHGSYSSGAQTDPTGPTSGSSRVHRGGSWGSGAGGCRVSYRFNFVPTNGYYMGLRIVLFP